MSFTGTGSRPVLLACILMLLGAGSAVATDKTLVVGVPAFPDSLTTGVSSFTASNLYMQTYDALVGRDAAGTPIPGLATAWQTVGETRWRFTLRHGVTFHDGSAFTAEDVKATIDRILDPKTIYGDRSRIAQIASVEIMAPDLVEIVTRAPFPTLVNALGDIPIESKLYLAQPAPATGIKPPIGTGPFKFVRWQPGDRYELAANKAYWDGAPPIDHLVMRQIPEAATRVASLLAGETQIIQEVPIDLLPKIKDSAVAEVASVETSVGLVLTFDATKPPFDNPKVRLALDYAVDKPLILAEILGGQGALLQGQLVTANTFGFNPDLKPRPYDPALARKLLAEAGYPNGFSTVITTRSGRYLSDVDIGNAVAGMWADVGVKTTLNVVEGGVWTRMAGAHDMGPAHLVGWFSLGDADLSSVWYTRGGDRAFWHSDEYDQLFVTARSTIDPAKRLAAYHRMMQILHDENPSIFLFGLPSINARSKRLVGWSPSADTILRLSKADLQ